MEKTVDLKWAGNMAFKTILDGHEITVDSSVDNNGQDLGPRPKALMLVALAGCTGMDVVSILKKMRIELTDFNVKVVSNLTEDHPKHFDKMKIVYEFGGMDLEYEKLKKAVDLSMERYCGVAAVYKKALPLDYEIIIKP
jgi:putative redox protein